MRALVAVAVALGAVACSAAAPAAESFNVLLMDDGHTWCAYKNQEEFQADAALKPTDSVGITYQGSALAELTYQIEAEGGDWVVIDRYAPSNGGLHLKRANLMAQESLQVIQETTIQDGKVGILRIVNITRLDGRKAKLANVDLPAVPVKADPLGQPFVSVVANMRNKSASKLCQ